MSHSPAPWKWTIEGEMDDDTFETPHVPVDWKTWKSLGYYNNPILRDANGEPIMSAGSGEYTPIQGNTPEERAANAAVVEAAPDLLAACKAALGAFEHNWAINWDDLALAIDKAEGKA